MERIEEGKVQILIPEVRETVSSDMPVFYNPRMRVNRDLAVLALRYQCHRIGRELMVADPLSASGVRALRFLKETSCVSRVYANDIDQRAISIMEENFRINGVPQERYEIHREDANFFLRRSWGFGFDYVDLDPFGTPVPFVESAALSMKRGGILSLTATDTAPLSGTYPKTCLRRYGARPLRNEFKHEVGIRILIKKVVELAAQHDIAMIPLFAYAHLHYFKLFFMKDRGANLTDSLMERIGYLLYCFKCANREAVVDVLKLRENCPVCGGRFSVGGPLWLGELWNREFVDFLHREAEQEESVHRETKRILSLIREESEVQKPGFYVLSKLCEKLGIPRQPPIRKAVEFFEGVRTHFEGDGFRTELPHREVLRRAKELKLIMEERLKGGRS